MGNFLSGIFDGLSGATQSNWLPMLLTLAGGLAGANSSSSTNPTGYQGGIPRYTAQRTALPQSAGGRPGEGGRRYFSDTQFMPMSTQPTPTPPPTPNAQGDADETMQFAAGGGISATPQAQAAYLSGASDGMADTIPAVIEGNQQAALSDGEFVIPADVVSGIGNGNSDAGAQQLYKMMERVRLARTGNPQQGKRINPGQMMPQ